MTGQLVYGSADQIAGRLVGGWGVLHATSDLTGEAQRSLLRLTSVALASSLPQFPSAQQLDERTVRFRINPSRDGMDACHSIEAGTDHTGRPGNVVSHCARIPTDKGLRPVDWFFSASWVRPYGPRQIAEARLPDQLNRPDGWAGTAAWLREDPSRAARIGWLVDVTISILLTGQRLVLKSASVTEAARWVSMLSWLLDAGTANQVRVRLGEDSRTVTEQLKDTPVIVCVTDASAPATLQGIPVIDTDWMLEPDDEAQQRCWRLPTGQSFPASPVGGLVTDLVYAEQSVADQVFARRDDLIARFLDEGPGFQIEHEREFLQLAWLATPGAQVLARDEPVRELLAGLDPRVRDWDEVVALAAEVGETPAAEKHLDVYALPAEPDALTAALIGAAKLGAEGLNVEALLLDGTLTQHIDEHPEARRPWLRAIAAVLGTDETTYLHGEDR